MPARVDLCLAFFFWHLSFACSQEEICYNPIHTEPVIPRVDHVSFHAPLIDAMILGKPGTVRCVAVGVAPEQSITWSVVTPHHVRLSQRRLKYRIQNRVETRTDAETGQCSTVVTSTMSFTVSELYNRTYVSCYFREVSNASYCSPGDSALASCAASRLITVIDGPLAPPKLVAAYSKLPSMVYSGESLQLTCTIMPGKDGDLLWVSTFKIEGFDPIIAQDSTRRVFVDEHNRTGIVSIFVHFFDKDWADYFNLSSFACFAYNVTPLVAQLRRIECLDSDEYCVSTPEVLVLHKPKKKDVPWFSLPSLGIFSVSVYLMLIVFCLAAPIRAFHKLEFEGEAKGDNVW